MIELALMAQAATGGEEFGWQIFRILVTSAVSGVIVALVTQAAVRATLKNVREKLAQHDKDIGGLASEIAAVSRERSACELAAARAYASRDDLGGVFERVEGIGERMGKQVESLRKDMQDGNRRVHDRVTEVATSVARFQGEGGE